MRDPKRTADRAGSNRPLPSVAVEQPLTARAGRRAPACAGPRGSDEHQKGPAAGDLILDRHNLPAVIVDRDHRIRAANRQCAALFADECLLGRRCYEVFHRRRAPCASGARRCPLRDYRKSGQPCRVVHVHHTRRGREHHEVSILPAGRGSACLELRPLAFASPGPCPCKLVGRSPAFNHMLELLLRAAPRQTPVLILGEPGTCRETVARALHRLGGRADGAFFPLYCHGLRRERFATELSRLTARAMEAAQPRRGSTLYLDDVGELGAGEQGDLLRLLKAGDRHRGSAGTEDLGCRGLRLICAARPDLRSRVTRDEFLDDLYYRVSVFPISLPALRERRQDLPLLAECLLRQIGGDRPQEIAPRTLRVLDRYPFPGNFRELRRILEHASLEAAGRQILPEDLPPECRSVARASHAALAGREKT